MYLVDPAAIDAIRMDALDYAQGISLDSFALNVIHSILIESKDRAFSITPYGAESNTLYSDAFEWQLEGYTERPRGADTNALYQLISLIKHIREEKKAACCAPGDALGQYGLDKPAITITAAYEAVSYEGRRYQDVLTVKASVMEGILYAAFDGDPMVYQLSEDTANLLAYFSMAESFLSTKICAIEKNEVIGLTILYGARQYEIEINREEAVSGPVIACTVNGSLTDEKVVQEILSAITGLKSYGLVSAAEASSAMTFSIRRKAPGFETMLMGVAPYNADFFTVSFDGIDAYLIGKNEVSAIEKLLKEL